MEPAIQVGQRLIVDRTAYWFRQPRRWEVIVFQCLHEPGELCVKRVAGLPGERVQIRDGQVVIDGQPQSAPDNLRYGPRAGQELGESAEYTLGPGEFFVLGDNSRVSVDSRVWAEPALPSAAITGRAVLRHNP
jgi:signal peptidase I